MMEINQSLTKRGKSFFEGIVSESIIKKKKIDIKCAMIFWCEVTDQSHGEEGGKK